MIALAFDTATSATAVALRRRDGRIEEARDDPRAGAHPGHATRLLPMADQLLREARLAWEQLELLAVGSGPGTFTGLRVGIATARGLAQSLGLPLAAISSPRALAAEAAGELAGGGVVLSALDARRGELFVALYDGHGEELAAPRPLPPDEVGGLLEQAGVAEPLGVGDGAVRYREPLAAAGVRVPEDGSPLHLLRARALCELAVRAGAAGDYRHALPDYRRRPDAELKAPAGIGAER